MNGQGDLGRTSKEVLSPTATISSTISVRRLQSQSHDVYGQGLWSRSNDSPTYTISVRRLQSQSNVFNSPSSRPYNNAYVRSRMFTATVTTATVLVQYPQPQSNGHGLSPMSTATVQCLQRSRPQSNVQLVLCLGWNVRLIVSLPRRYDVMTLRKPIVTWYVKTFRNVNYVC